MSLMRIMGALLLVCAGAAVGLSKNLELKRRVRLLSALTAALGVMGEEIATLHTPLPELFHALAERGPEPLRAFFAGMEEETGSRPLSELWEERTRSLPLSSEELDALRPLGMSLGRYDGDRQASEIGLVRTRLEALLEAGRAERDGRGRTYLGLGASLGAMLAVILF